MAFQLTRRDEQTLLALQKLPLTSRQLLRLSGTFTEPFPGERVLRRRMQRLADAGMVRRFFYAFPSGGRNPAYWRLTRRSWRLINGITGSAFLPRRSLFGPMGVSLHFHTHCVTEVVVRLLVDAHCNGVVINNLDVESSLDFDGRGVITPDASIQLRTPDDRIYRFYLELDTASERVATLQRIPSSIQKKLESYERYRRQSDDEFRVLFVTTTSARRAHNILRFAAGLSGNRAAKTVYGVHLPDLLSSADCLSDQIFLDHRLKPAGLVRKARFCTLDSIREYPSVLPQLISTADPVAA